MSEVDELFRLLSDAPPRSAEIVKRVALAGMDLPQVASLFGVDVERARVLVFRAFQDVRSGGSARVPDDREAAEVAAMVGPHQGAPGEGREARQLWDQLRAHREALQERLAKSAAEFATSPHRARDELLRWVAIVAVIALTAFFYWREQNKPRPPLQQRPMPAPTAAP